MTGWGRTGTLFACEQAEVEPDIACYSKGLTGGSLPLAVTVCTEEIFRSHYSTDRAKTLFHSSSYTANPIACAAAVANLKLWKDCAVLKRVADVSERLANGMDRLRGHRHVENVRQTGAIAAFDVKTSDGGYLASVGPRLQSHFSRRNVLLRPLGNTVYVMPPYCVTQADVDEVFDAIMEAVDF
jgi:adenosylmethionine-8-amino-7-oxononanoate aminotransferase